MGNHIDDAEQRLEEERQLWIQRKRAQQAAEELERRKAIERAKIKERRKNSMFW